MAKEKAAGATGQSANNEEPNYDNDTSDIFDFLEGSRDYNDEVEKWFAARGVASISPISTVSSTGGNRTANESDVSGSPPQEMVSAAAPAAEIDGPCDWVDEGDETEGDGLPNATDYLAEIPPEDLFVVDTLIAGVVSWLVGSSSE